MSGPLGPGFANDVRLLVTRGFELNPSPNDGPDFFLSYVVRRGFSQPQTETGQSGAEVVDTFPLRFYTEITGNGHFQSEVRGQARFSDQIIGRCSFINR